MAIGNINNINLINDSFALPDNDGPVENNFILNQVDDDVEVILNQDVIDHVIDNMIHVVHFDPHVHQDDVIDNTIHAGHFEHHGHDDMVDNFMWLGD